MNAAQRLISAGFATAALASATVPALAVGNWPNIDLEGPAAGSPTMRAAPPRAEGYVRNVSLRADDGPVVPAARAFQPDLLRR